MQKMLAKLPVEKSSGRVVDKEVMDGCKMDDESFVSSKTDLGIINQSLELVGVSPLKRMT